MLEEYRVYLSDAPRLRAFRKAVARKVKPGAVVLDLGAGTGILGILALRAGAARVYAVDRGPVLGAARAAAAAAGFADRWTGIRGMSTEVDLPEKADLVVADHVGCFGFDYGILESFADARRRHLKRGGDFLPETVEVHLALLDSPALYRQVSFWGGAPAGVRLPGLRRLAANTVAYGRPASREVFSKAVRALDVDVRTAPDGPLEGRAVLTASRAGTVHGIFGFFRSRLAPGTWITNDPRARECLKRSPVFLPLERPARLSRGDRVRVSLRIQPGGGMTTWVVGIEGREPATHSSFLGRVLEPGDLHRLRPDHVPGLGPRGEAMARVLELCRAGRSVDRIRREILRRHARLFPTEARATAFVASVLDAAARQAE